MVAVWACGKDVMISRFVLFAGAVFASGCSALGAPLDDFLARPDTNYGWRVVRTEQHPEGTYALLDLTSQAWRGPAEVNRPVWHHRLEVYLPKDVAHDLALLDINGGDAGQPSPARPSTFFADMAVRLKTVTARLADVPNQPLAFAAEAAGANRREDQILSYGWARQIETGDMDWLPQFAMAKSAVRAMDAVIEYCRMRNDGVSPVKRFVLTGASKRGWTSWLAAAGDQRVAGVAPRVIDLLHLEPSFQHHRAAYGRYADAVRDYVHQGIPERMGTPALDPSRRALDPWEYRDRLTMPKLIVNSAGDQFFLPDSWRFYWDDLNGAKYLRYVPNTDHGIGPAGEQTVRSFFASLVLDKPMPEFAWKETGPGALRVETKARPRQVKVWRAANPQTRDFMLKTIGPSWKPEELSLASTGVYEAAADVPAKGWTAVLIELSFDDPAGYSEPLVLSTGVSVTPAALPFAR